MFAKPSCIPDVRLQLRLNALAVIDSASPDSAGLYMPEVSVIRVGKQ